MSSLNGTETFFPFFVSECLEKKSRKGEVMVFAFFPFQHKQHLRPCIKRNRIMSYRSTSQRFSCDSSSTYLGMLEASDIYPMIHNGLLSNRCYRIVNVETNKMTNKGIILGFRINLLINVIVFLTSGHAFLHIRNDYLRQQRYL